jgi:DNA-binding Lrp family transcriptional regulator
VSRGIGKTQQRILSELAVINPPPELLVPHDCDYALTVVELSERIGLSDRQIRRAVRALEDRGLVIATKTTVWHGVGEYGPLVRRREAGMGEYGPEVPTARVVRKGEPWPWKRGYVAAIDVELVHAGMPTPALLVWAPEKRAAYLQDAMQAGLRFGVHPREDEMEEYTRLTAK